MRKFGRDINILLEERDLCKKNVTFEICFFLAKTMKIAIISNFPVNFSGS